MSAIAPAKRFSVGRFVAAMPTPCMPRSGCRICAALPRFRTGCRPKPWSISSMATLTVRCPRSGRTAAKCWKPRGSPAPASRRCITRLETPSSASASGSHCMSGESCTAILVAATGSTSPASVPPSIWRRGWKKSPAALVARSWPLQDLPEYAPAAGPIWASFRSPVFRRPSGSTACWTKHRRREPAAPADLLLFLRLGGEQQRVAFGAPGVGGARRLGLGDVLGEDRDHAYAEPVRGDHDLVGLVLSHAEFRLQHRHDKFAGREVVVDEDDLVQARPFGLGLDLGFRLGDGVDHSG